MFASESYQGFFNTITIGGKLCQNTVCSLLCNIKGLGGVFYSYTKVSACNSEVSQCISCVTLDHILESAIKFYEKFIGVLWHSLIMKTSLKVKLYIFPSVNAVALQLSCTV